MQSSINQRCADLGETCPGLSPRSTRNISSLVSFEASSAMEPKISIQKQDQDCSQEKLIEYCPRSLRALQTGIHEGTNFAVTDLHGNIFRFCGIKVIPCRKER